MTPLDRDAAASDALLTDLYLDALLAGSVLSGDRSLNSGAGAAPELDPAARTAADRLRRDLVRVHPSFRFEERLATRLAEAAMSMRLPNAVGAEGRLVPFPTPLADREPPFDVPGSAHDRSRPLLIGGALTSAALSIAGAAFVAWRRGRPARGPRRTSPMARAARAAHATRRPAVRASLADPRRFD
ncbi:MAG TPA: hypothetical protein VFP22_04895 [Candidatus Limnocylindrales bacterium]|nr:hypothetical protein [Candidatus Limnocylindrales bacterium]